MKILAYPLKLVDSLADRIMAVVSAVLFSQVPAFISHYVQRLGGHVAEAQRNVATWQAIADKTADGSLERLIETYRQNTAPSVIEAGNKCLGDLDRLKDLQVSLDALLQARPFGRLFAFLEHVDADVARGTWKSFIPNLPLDLESLVYALIGLILGVALYQGLKIVFRSLGRRLARKRPESPSENQDDATESRHPPSE